MHIGVDLTKEAVWDSSGSFDIFEYLSGTVHTDMYFDRQLDSHDVF